MAKFINPFTEFGFKLIFGTEKSKPFLIHFLNAVLKDEPGYEEIVDIEYKDKESFEGARTMKQEGISIAAIVRCTGLSEETIDLL